MILTISNKRKMPIYKVRGEKELFYFKLYVELEEYVYRPEEGVRAPWSYCGYRLLVKE